MLVQAVILSGGLGTRLRSVNADLPKIMIPVAGYPFMYHLLLMLKRKGLNEFLFLVAYKSDIVIEFLAKTAIYEDLQINWVVENSPMGTGGALRHAEKELKDDFLLINGDSYLDMDYMNLVHAFRNSSFKAMMTVYDNACSTDVKNNVATDGQGRIVTYDRKHETDRLNNVDAGVVAMKKTVVSMIETGRVCSLEDEVYPRLINEKELGYYNAPRRFYDIGTPDRLREFEAVAQKGLNK